MKISLEQLTEEKKYLSETLKVLKSIIEQQSESIDSKIQAVDSIKKYIWENTGVLDDVEIRSTMNDINNEVDYTNQNIERLVSLKKSLSSPYFGRVDFNLDDDTMKVYIGINGIIQGINNYVVDWRTPIASLFYNYGIGAAKYSAPSGDISGEISLKRQYKINDGEIERCFDSDINIDDDYLQEILSNSSSERMTNIVNTIQKDQNAIIRNVTDKYLIVQGIAGSGKTSVALHRIAYLLYSEKQLSNSNVLIFSPNDVFSQYISNVLPELGEQNVLQTTFIDFANTYIDGNIESFTSFLERYYTVGKNNSISNRTNTIKLSDEFKESIDNHIKEYVSNGYFSEGLVINGKKYTNDQLNNLFHNRFSNKPMAVRVNEMAEYLSNDNKSIKTKIVEKLKSIFSIDNNALSLYKKILNDNNLDLDNDVTKVTPKGIIKKISYSDLLPLLYIGFELNGYPQSKGIKHIIIDEAQDYTLLQFDILKKIFKNASFTILGDINQTINPFYKYSSLAIINSLFNDKATYVELTKTYRSSQEIIEFTNKILGINNSCSVRHSNSIPVELGTINDIDTLLSCIHNMEANNMKRIAIITKDNLETQQLYEELKKDIEDITIINKESQSKIGDMVILPSYISKGLEFDGVIVYTSKDNEYQEKEKNLFYVVCTRAQHSLSVYNQKTLIKEGRKQ